MAGGKFKSLSVTLDVYEKLKKIAEKRGFATLADTIAYLVTLEEVYSNLERTLTDILVKLEKFLTNTSVRAEEGLTNTSVRTSGSLTDISVRTSSGLTDTSVRQQSTTEEAGRGKSAWSILEKQKVDCISSMKKVVDREAVIGKLRRLGAVIVSTDEDVCAVLPEFWFEFKRKLNSIKTADDQEVLSRLKDERMKKLFTMLRKSGGLYLDSKTKEWVFDYSFIEEPSPS
jgi:hypothetical protein